MSQCTSNHCVKPAFSIVTAFHESFTELPKRSAVQRSHLLLTDAQPTYLELGKIRFPGCWRRQNTETWTFKIYWIIITSFLPYKMKKLKYWTMPKSINNRSWELDVSVWVPGEKPHTRVLIAVDVINIWVTWQSLPSLHETWVYKIEKSINVGVGCIASTL